jgi:hypothetical protein
MVRNSTDFITYVENLFFLISLFIIILFMLKQNK